MIGKSLKNDYVEEYQIRKIVETFFSMAAKGQHVSADPDDPTLNI